MSFNDKDRLIVDQDIDQFVIYFEAIFDHPPTVKCFTGYLGATFNGESCQFLECVNEYRKVKHERKRFQMAHDLFERFIAEGANTQLNLRGDIRNKIQKVLNPDNVSSSPISIVSARTSTGGNANNNNPNSPQSNGSPVPFVSRHSLDSTNSTDSASVSSESVSTIANRCKSPTTDYSASNLSSNSTNGLNCPKNLFDEVESSVLLSLKENNFKSFLESDYFKTYLKTQPLKVLYEIGSVKEDSQLFYVESLGDLKNESFSINDFKFLKMQLSNYDPNEWEVIGSSKHHKCYFSKKSYDMGESIGLNFFKFDCTFPFNIKHVMNTIFEKEYRLQYDGNLCEIEQLNYVEKKATDGPVTGSSLMASSVTREIYKLVWPFNPREFIVSSSGVFDTSTNTYYIGKKSCVTNKAPSEPKKGVVRAVSMGGWAFQAIDENTCRYSQIFYLDFKGNIPRGVVKTILKDRAKSFLKLGTKYIKINEKRGFLCKESNEMWRSIEENGNVII
ncbi:G protein signaling regulator [Naegleria gruberi]|uniref:G protein signaling regulator n=1 Tax=Naegleria gruberi TaxID=5762 RepID=D2VL08_NAEGR|nr:G protein signaling regulator [Naegleria gruberi]EFC42540.1 G protein signaling regulator [Naegleria gruberi]|eukprot:XP_002675284.1 G protein signaling regulator [Naegleria gruberi strain NEG-M]